MSNGCGWTLKGRFSLEFELSRRDLAVQIDDGHERSKENRALKYTAFMHMNCLIGEHEYIGDVNVRPIEDSYVG